MNNPDKIEDKLDTEGNLYAKLYKKEYNFNISTNDTETGSHRVFINYLNEESSTQFPFYKPK